MMNSNPVAFHRDIKTANILLDAHGVAKVADFGLSNMVGSGEDFTVDHVSGSPGYACPVYLETGRVSEQSEAYSFGIVLLELLTGLAAALVQVEQSGVPSASAAISFPLAEMVALEKPGAHNRIMSGLDVVAGWPPQFAAEVAELALSCVATRQETRPAFEIMVQVLRHLSNSSGADESQQVPVLPPVAHCIRKGNSTISGQSGAIQNNRSRGLTSPIPWPESAGDGYREECRSSPTYHGPDVGGSDVVRAACNLESVEPPCATTSLLERLISGGPLFDTACCTRINRACADRISVPMQSMVAV
jgi:serine/threonine protein kinase